MIPQMQDDTGLLPSDIAHIVAAAAALPAIEQVILFGSRAKGTYKRGSDVDLAIKGLGVTYDTVLELRNQLNEELPLPYFFDVVDYAICDPALRGHIDRVGKLLFVREA